MNESDIYREWPPPPGWRSMVACRWQQRVDRETDHRVVPDGCADVIVSQSGTAVAVGLADRAVVHHLGSGAILLGLRLRTTSA